MDVTAFRTGVSRLGALPEGEVTFAVQTAERLNDHDREELFDRLVDMNTELTETENTRLRIVGDMYGLAAELAEAVEEFERTHDAPLQPSPRA